MINFNLSNKHRAVLYTAISAVFMSFGFVSTKLLLRYTNPENLNFFWWLSGAIAALAIALVRKEKLEQLVRNYWKIALVIGILESAGSVLWFNAINQIGPSLTAFLVRFSVIFAVFLGIFFLKEKIAASELVGMGIAIAGAFAINFSNGAGIKLGALLVIIAALFFAINTVVTKLYVHRLNVVQMMILRSVSILPMLFVYTVGTNHFVIPSVPLFFAMGGAAILSQVIGFFFFFNALRLMEVSKITVLRSVDPFLVVLYSLIIFKQVPNIMALAGGLLIVVGIIIMVAGKELKKKIITLIPA